MTERPVGVTPARLRARQNQLMSPKPPRLTRVPVPLSPKLGRLIPLPRPLPQPVRQPRLPPSPHADRRLKGRLALTPPKLPPPQPILGRVRRLIVVAKRPVGRRKQRRVLRRRQQTEMARLLLAGKVPNVNIARQARSLPTEKRRRPLLRRRPHAAQAKTAQHKQARNQTRIFGKQKTANARRLLPPLPKRRRQPAQGNPKLPQHEENPAPVVTRVKPLPQRARRQTAATLPTPLQLDKKRHVAPVSAAAQQARDTARRQAKPYAAETATPKPPPARRQHEKRAGGPPKTAMNCTAINSGRL